jgi:hypothetical protein
VNHIGSSGRDDVLGRDRTVSELFRSASGLFPNRPHTILFGNVLFGLLLTFSLEFRLSIAFGPTGNHHETNHRP